MNVDVLINFLCLLFNIPQNHSRSKTAHMVVKKDVDHFFGIGLAPRGNIVIITSYKRIMIKLM